jgi:hypothetical protein
MYQVINQTDIDNFEVKLQPEKKKKKKKKVHKFACGATRGKFVAIFIVGLGVVM